MAAVLINAVVALLYFFTGYLGLLIPIGVHVTLFWPPTGIAIVALLRYGLRALPGIWIGAFGISRFVHGTPLLACVLTATALAAGMALGWWLLTRVARFTGRFESRQNVWDFVWAGCIVPTGVTALLGSGIVKAFGIAEVPWLDIFRNWWMGDALGVLLVAPALLFCNAETWEKLKNHPRLKRHLIPALIAIAAGCAIFLGPPQAHAFGSAQAYVLLMFLIWVALGGNGLASTGVALALAVVAVIGTELDRGPFVLGAADIVASSQLELWSFVSAAAVLNLIILASQAERDCVERALVEASTQLREAEDRSLTMVSHAALDGRILKVPPRLCELLGYTEAELLTMRYQDFSHPEDSEANVALNERIKRGEVNSIEMEKRYRRKDGSYVWVHLNSTGVQNEKGELLHFRAYIRDISEQKKAEEDLRAGEERLRALMDSPLIGIVFWNKNGDISDANDYFLNMVGCSREDLRSGRVRWRDLTPPEYAHLDDNAIREMTERGRCTPFEKVYVHKDGRRVPIIVGAVMLDSQRTGGVAYILDITEKRGVEMALRETAERLTLIAEATNDALWDRNITTGKSWWNDTYRTRFGFGSETLPSFDSWKSRVHPEDLPRVMDGLSSAETGAARSSWSAEYRYRLEDGEYAHVLDRAIILRDEKGNAYRIAGAMLDLTYRVKADAAMRQLAERLDLIAKASNDSLWDRDLRTGEGWWNDVYAQRYGLENGRLPTVQEWLARVHPDDRLRVVNTLTESQGGGSPAWTCEYRVRLPDGGYAHVLDRALIVRDESGVPIRVIGSTLDLTERMRAQQALRESERQLATLIDNLPGMTYRCKNDRDWSLEFISSACERITGYTAEQLKRGMPTLNSLFHPQDVERVWNDVQMAVAAKQPFFLKYRLRVKSGEVRWMQEYGRGVYDADGKLLLLEGIILDATDIETVSAALRESEARYRLLFENAPDAILTLDVVAGNFVDNNMQAEALLKMRSAEIRVVGPADVSPPEQADGRASAEAAKEYIQQAVDGRTPRYEWLVRDKLGNLIPCEIWLTRLPDKERVLVRGSVVDISLRKRMEEKARENEERYRLLFDRAPEAITILDMATGKFVDNNSQAEILFKKSSAELKNTGPAQLSPPVQPDGSLSSEKAFAFCQEALKGGTPRFEWVHLDANGQMVPVEIWLTRLPDKDRVLIRGSLVDISARKQLEDQLRQAQKMEAVGKLAGGIAHDFNNLLVAIIGYSDLIRSNTPKGGELNSGAIQILAAAERAADLTRQLLAYSRKQILQPKIISLSKTVADMHRLLERLLGEDIEFVRMLEAAGSVSADPGQVEQVIMNLALNARDAMPKGGTLTIETQDVNLDENYRLQGHGEVLPGPYVMLAVSDTGIGMKKELIDRIFEPFFTTKEVGKGTGLGLSTVYGIVKQSNGHVFVYSEVGKGSTFKVYLPRVKAANAMESSTKAPVVLSSKRETVLVVEDEDGVRGLIVTVLERDGYTVLNARSGPDAIKLASEFPGVIDLLVTDVVLPKMQGGEIARALKKARPNLQVLYMSGYTENAIVHHGVVDTGIEYLQKPFMPSEFSAKVRAVLDAHKA